MGEQNMGEQTLGVTSPPSFAQTAKEGWGTALCGREGSGFPSASSGQALHVAVAFAPAPVGMTTE